MPHAVELYFDSESTKRIERLRTVLKTEGIPVDEGTSPHISLALYHDLQITQFHKELESYARTLKSFDIAFTSSGMFTGKESVLFLTPKPTEELLQLNRNFHISFTKYKADAVQYYLPEYWVPHCTLAIGALAEELANAVKILANEFEPFKATIESVGTLSFPPNKELERFSLFE